VELAGFDNNATCGERIAPVKMATIRFSTTDTPITGGLWFVEHAPALSEPAIMKARLLLSVRLDEEAKLVREGLYRVRMPDDTDLIQAIARQESDALMHLYDRYNRLCFAVAYRIVNDASLAEEVVQDAYLQVWNRASTFDLERGRNVRGWLLTIVHHRSIDFRRRHVDRQVGQVALDAVEHALAVPDVWREVAANLTREEMRAAIDTLPRDQKRAIELAYFEGMTHGEIAEREATPLGTVKGRIRLGLKKLRIELLAHAGRATGFDQDSETGYIQ